MSPSSVALVTGCSSGIGFETALALARNGYRVFATVRDLKKAKPLQQAALGLPLEILVMDVDKAPSVKQAVGKLLARTGRIDVLVNNAGWGAFGALEEFTDAEIEAQYQTNVFGLMRVARAVLPAMRRQRSGRILNIGSLAGKMTFVGIALYCSSKYAVEALTEGLRVECRPFGIDVAVVEPGSIHTPFKVNRRQAKAFLSGKSQYQGVLEKILAYGNSSDTPGAPPSAVAGTILKALKASRMALRYPVGRDAHLFPFITWFMPSWFHDLAMRRVYAKFQKGVVKEFTPPWRSGLRKDPPVVLVTGANSGFGLSITRLLAQNGCRVYATYRDKKKAKELFELAKRYPVFPHAMDVTDVASVRKVVQAIDQKEVLLDVLVNNAGFVMAGFLEDVGDQELKEQFDTNVFGLLRVTRESAPLLKRTGSAKVLNIGSISGRVAFPGIAAYSATKHAVRSLSAGLRMELREWGVGVTDIQPGTFATRVVSNARYAKAFHRSPYAPFAAQVEEVTSREFKKAQPPERLGELVLSIVQGKGTQPFYLAGPDARFMALLKKFLPDAFLDRFFRAFFPWSRFPS